MLMIKLCFIAICVTVLHSHLKGSHDEKARQRR